MGKLPLIAAVASAMWALPASAEDGGNVVPFKPEVTLAQLDLCVGPDCRDRDRYYDRSDDDWRYLHGDNWRYYRGGACRDVTFREQRGEEGGWCRFAADIAKHDSGLVGSVFEEVVEITTDGARRQKGDRQFGMLVLWRRGRQQT